MNTQIDLRIGRQGGALGISLPDSSFRLRQEQGVIPPGALQDIHSWRTPIIQVKNFLDRETYEPLALNFDRLIAEQGDEREDDVPAVEIGGTIYGKTTKEYLDASAEAAQKMLRLFAGSLHLPEFLRAAVQASVPAGCVVRALDHGGRLASDMRAVTWRGTGEYALKLHTDEEQFLTESIAALPVFGCSSPIAANVYPRAASSTLRVYNRILSRDTKRRLGLIERLGYPIDEELLADTPYIDVLLDDGDLILALGSLAHGVPYRPGVEKRQLFNSFLIVKPDDPSQIYMVA